MGTKSKGILRNCERAIASLPLNLHKSSSLIILTIAMTFSAIAQNPNIAFSFSLTQTSKTSAGVYKRSTNTLIKTLWSNVSYPAGTHTAYWDRTNDEGLFLSDTGYYVKVISNNVNYSWEGVVGNNSDSISGTSKVRAFQRFYTLAFTGNYGYYGVGYTEGITSSYKFNINSPNNKTNILSNPWATIYAQNDYVATDGNFVYWTGYDPYSPGISFTYATRVSNDREVAFTNGSSITLSIGRYYPNVIDLYTTNTNAIPSGLAVQKNGSLLFVAHKNLNQINVLNKTTGALVNTLSFTAPREICMDANDNLWVLSGANTIEKFTVNSNGTLSSATLSISGLSEPLAMAVSPNNSKICIIDGAASQQIKAFSNTTGAPVWTLGSAGGYINNASVNDYKFYFSDSVTLLSKPFIAFQSDSSFWVGDVGNERVQHYSAARTFINRIMCLPHSYSTVVDRNNPNRVFNEYLEFNVDYTKPLGPNNGSWTLVNNWRRGIKSNYYQDDKLRVFIQLVTLSNNRTYAILDEYVSGIRKPEIVELVPNAKIRYTGIKLQDFAQDIIEPNGTLRRIVSGRNVGDSGYWETQALTGFNGQNNPVWGSKTRTAWIPRIAADDPAFSNIMSPAVTSGGYNIIFNAEKDNKGYHLGAIKNGSNKYSWRTSKATNRNYWGPMTADGAFDIGNNVEYPGGDVYAIDRNIFWNYHGEFWKNSQTNIWNHYHESGLMVSQFGAVAPEAQALEEEAYKMGAGNVLSSTVVKVGSDYYIYHNDESVHGGIHRWKISNVNSIAEQNSNLTMQVLTGTGLIGNYFDGKDLNNFNMKISTLNTTVNLTTPPSQVTSSSNFSARWTGFVKPAFSQAYTFYVNTSLGVRLWVNNVLVIDRWTNASLFENTSSAINLIAGNNYAIRMEINGGTATLSWSSSSQAKQIIPSSALFPGEVTSYANGYNLLEGIENTTTLWNNSYGWTRNTSSDFYNSDQDYWTLKTNYRSHLMNDPSLSINFRKYNANYSVSRDLGTTTNCMKSWNVSGLVLFYWNYPNDGTNNEGYFEILDDQNKIIARITHEGQYVNSNTRVNQIKMNGVAIVNDYEPKLYNILNRTTPFSVNANGKMITFSYGAYTPITVKMFDTTANWNKPKTIRFRFGGGDYDKAIDLRQFKFTPVVNTTPVLTNSGNNSICQGSSITLTAPTGTSYLWSNNATTQSITVNTAGNFSVQVNYGNSCVLTSAITSITVKAAPTPTITLAGAGLRSNYTLGNQWYLNGQIIAGATAQTLRVTRSGTYSVIVTDTNGCSGSATFSVPLPFKDVKIVSECLENEQAKFTWYTMDADDEFRYGVEYSIDNGKSWVQIGEINASRTFSGNTVLTYTLDYQKINIDNVLYRWYSLDEAGNRVQNKLIDGPNCNAATVSVYPNPFNEQLSLKIKSTYHSLETMEIDIIDINGKTVYNRTLSSIETSSGLVEIGNMDNLSNGVYQIRIGTADKILLNEKIVKTN